MTDSWEMRVDRAKLDRVETGPGVDTHAELEDGQTRLAISSFAMTANNVSYAVFGDAMAYWQFFPTVEGWGLVPVWGYADVEASAHDQIAEGHRYYGYWPAASHLVVSPTRVDDTGFVDGATHRGGLPGFYNHYSATTSDIGTGQEREALNSLFRPLFMTSFFIDDLLAESDLRGAERVVISSASSKTGFALAFCLHQRGVPVVGLTSAGNVGFTSTLGWYDSVVTYDQIESLVDGPAAVYVDMSGHAGVRSRMHGCGIDLRASIAVGATHWDSAGMDVDLPGPAPEFFFAPTQVAKRIDELGQAEVDKRVATVWEEFIAKVGGSMSIKRVHGAEGLSAAYLSALDGSADPAVGVIVEP